MRNKSITKSIRIRTEDIGKLAAHLNFPVMNLQSAGSYHSFGYSDQNNNVSFIIKVINLNDFTSTVEITATEQTFNTDLVKCIIKFIEEDL